MTREIKSPKTNAAQKEVVAVQSATTKIKEIIVADIDAGVDRQETTKKIAKIIAEVAKDISDPQLLKETKQSLAMSTQKWYYEYSMNSKIIREATKQNIKNSLSRASSAVIKGRTYNLGEVFKEFDDASTNNAFRGVVENFRPFIDDARKGLPTVANYDKLLKGQLKVLASDPPISNRLTKAGAPYKVNLRNRAEMFVRYEVNMQDLQNLIDAGVEYAWISSHADASPRCAPFQGKLYSLKNEKGSINGHRYYPIEDALKGRNGDGNGCISGYNCRHRLIEYTPNSKPPNDYTSAEIQKEYKIDAKQRSYENRIRNLKIEERVFRANGNVEEASKLRKRWRRLNKEYEIYSAKNGRAFYRWRTVVSDDEALLNKVPDEKLARQQARIKEIDAALENSGKDHFAFRNTQKTAIKVGDLYFEKFENQSTYNPETKKWERQTVAVFTDKIENARHVGKIKPNQKERLFSEFAGATEITEEYQVKYITHTSPHLNYSERKDLENEKRALENGFDTYDEFYKYRVDVATKEKQRLSELAEKSYINAKKRKDESLYWDMYNEDVADIEIEDTPVIRVISQTAKKLGAEEVHTSSKSGSKFSSSVYLKLGDVELRLSDHELPQIGDRTTSSYRTRWSNEFVLNHYVKKRLIEIDNEKDFEEFVKSLFTEKYKLL